MRTLPEDRVPLVCECDTRNPVDGPCEKCSIEIDQPEVLEMSKHPECAHVCQQADQYGVWPEHSCHPTCVWLKYSGNPLNEPPTEEEKVKARHEIERANNDLQRTINQNDGGI